MNVVHQGFLISLIFIPKVKCFFIRFKSMC